MSERKHLDFAEFLEERGCLSEFIVNRIKAISSEECPSPLVRETASGMSPRGWVKYAFSWGDTPEGIALWKEVDHAWVEAVDNAVTLGLPWDGYDVQGWPTDPLAVAVKYEDWRRDHEKAGASGVVGKGGG